MDLLSPKTKQLLKRYQYQLICLDTYEIKGTFKSRNMASKKQKEFFKTGIICKLINKG